jgi:hypothetical protein
MRLRLVTKAATLPVSHAYKTAVAMFVRTNFLVCSAQMNNAKQKTYVYAQFYRDDRFKNEPIFGCQLFALFTKCGNIVPARAKEPDTNLNLHSPKKFPQTFHRNAVVFLCPKIM